MNSTTKTGITLIILLLLISLKISAQQVKEYNLYVNDTIVSYAGKSRMAMAINGQIPAPALVFTEGDTAVIRVHNQMKHETAIHWHGLVLPNEQDGVPYLTSAPVKPGTVHTYTFPIVQTGTYWYHSHSGLQEQMGLYGAFVIHKKLNDPSMRSEDKLPEYTVVLSEWTNTDAMEVNRMLHVGSDWFAIKKGSVQSYWEALRKGHFKTKVVNEWKRMKAMDISDVYYERFLLNGQHQDQVIGVKPGDKVRLRIANSGASTYFWLQYAGGKITVIATDGVDVEPVEVDRLLIAVAETYDIVVTIPDDGMSYELRATAEDRSGFSSLWLGEGHKMTAPTMPKLDYFAGMKMMNDMMKMNGDMNPMGMKMEMQVMDMNTVMYPEITGSNNLKSNNGMSGMSKENNVSGNNYHSAHGIGSSPDNLITLNYGMLKSPIKTNLPADVPVRELRFELTGNMNRYVWTWDNKTVSESDKILIKQGENLRIIFYNNTMMRHPMHLHGHFFRILNGQGDYAPLKNTLDIMPMETDTVEFNASEHYGDWYFHCHILYHMMAGMGRIFTYENSPPNLQVPDPDKAIKKVYAEDRMFYLTAFNDFAYSGNMGEVSIQNTRWSIKGEWRLGYDNKKGYEAEVHVGRYIGAMQWFMPYIGFDWRYRKGGHYEKNLFGQVDTRNDRQVGCLGFQYTLPMLLIVDSRIDTGGKLRLQLSREDIPLASRLRMKCLVNSDWEYLVGLRYIVTPNIGLSSSYHNELGLGAGLTLTY